MNKIKNESGFTPEQEKFITNIFGKGENGIFSNPNNPNSSGLSGDDYKQLEAIKLILGMFANKDFIKSATNLPEDELDDITDALMINSYADCPELNEWIDNRLELARSRIAPNSTYHNLLQLLSEISGKSGISIDAMREQNMILGKLRR